jgi:hypothetical protein
MVFTILAAAVILFGVTHFKDRWMQPFFFLVPLYVFVRLQDVNGLVPGRLSWFTGVLALSGCLFLVAPLAQAWVAPWFGLYSRLHVPFEDIARQLREAGFRQGTIVADTAFIGGNLRLVFPRARVVTPEMLSGLRATSHVTGQCLVVWHGAGRESLPPPLPLFLEKTLHAPLPSDQTPRYIDARLKHSHEAVFRIGFLLLADGRGDCR